jgi:hypothetical protein
VPSASRCFETFPSSLLFATSDQSGSAGGAGECRPRFFSRGPLWPCAVARTPWSVHLSMRRHQDMGARNQ